MFRQKIKKLILNTDFQSTEVFSHNHPNDNQDRVDYNLHNTNVRIIFEKSYYDEYFYLTKELFVGNSILTLKSGKYKLEDLYKLNELINDINKIGVIKEPSIFDILKRILK